MQQRNQLIFYPVSAGQGPWPRPDAVEPGGQWAMLRPTLAVRGGPNQEVDNDGFQCGAFSRQARTRAGVP
jgi:hypothetical protein